MSHLAWFHEVITIQTLLLHFIRRGGFAEENVWRCCGVFRRDPGTEEVHKVESCKVIKLLSINLKNQKSIFLSLSVSCGKTYHWARVSRRVTLNILYLLGPSMQFR